MVMKGKVKKRRGKRKEEWKRRGKEKRREEGNWLERESHFVACLYTEIEGKRMRGRKGRRERERKGKV